MKLLSLFLLVVSTLVGQTTTYPLSGGSGGGLSDPGGNGVINRTGLNTTAPATVTNMSAPLFCVDVGATDAYACTLSPAITAYIQGTHYRFKANTANTGAATVAFNGIASPVAIKKAAGGITTDLVDNDIRAGQWVDLIYDGTNMQMQSQLGNGSSGGGTFASQAQAEAGTDETTYMNPLRTAQAIAAQGAGLVTVSVNAGTMTIGGNCSTAKPCVFNFGSYVVSITAAGTATITTGDGTAYVYVTTAGFNVGYSTAPNVSCDAGCTAVSGVTTFPIGSIPLYTWQALTGAWVSNGGADSRGALAARPISNGTGLTCSETTGTVTCSVNAAVVVTFTSGTSAPPGTCSIGAVYIKTDTAATYDCTSTDTWTQRGTGSGGSDTISMVAGTTGTTAGLLVKTESGTANVITATSAGTDVVGVATETKTSGQTVIVGLRGTQNCVADNNITAGNLIIVGTSTAGRCRDSLTPAPLSISRTSQIVGRALASGTTGNQVSILFSGPGFFGLYPSTQHTKFTAAGCNVSSAGPGFDIPATNGPVANCYGTSPHRFGALDFADGSTDLTATFHHKIPSALPSTTTLLSEFFTNVADAGQNFVVMYQTVCVGDGEDVLAPTYNAVQRSTVANLATASRKILVTLNGLTQTGCGPNETMFIRIGRELSNVSDTLAGTLSLIGVTVVQ